MATLATAFVAIRPEASKFGAELKSKTEATAGSVGKSTGTTFGKSMVGAIGAAVAGIAVLGFLKGAIAEAQEAAKVGKLTEAVIKSTGGTAKVTATQIGDLANRLSNLAGVDDEVIQSSENVLLTFTKVRNEAGRGNDIFNQGTEAALNLSAALGTDLQAATLLVGKALNDPISGLTALKKAGIQLTDQQKESIKSFVETGHIMEAQKIILGELTTQFGGAAAAAASPADKARVAWGNLQEDLGNKLLPTLNRVLQFGIRNQDWLVPLAATIAAAVLATKALSTAQSVLGLKLDATASSAGRVAGAFGLAFTALTAAESNGTLRKIGDDLDHMAAGWGAFSDKVADDKSTFDAVFGDGGVVDNLIGDGPAAETSLHRIARGAHDLADATGEAAEKGESLLDAWDRLHGVMATADEAVLDARRAIDGLKDTFKEGGKAIDGMSLASSENRVELEQAARKAVEAATKYEENGHSAAEAAHLLAQFKDEAVKATGATGKNKDQVKALADELFRIPENVHSNIDVTANLSVVLRSSIAQVQKKLNSLALAEGGIVKFFASGGIEDHVAQIVKAGTLRIFGEDEAGGEAYIPLSPAKRPRSTKILETVAHSFGYGLVRDVGGTGGTGVAGVAGLAGWAGSGHVVAAIEANTRATLAVLAAVERVAPGVGRQLGGAVSASFQLSRAR
jgi:hypothetical protein